MTYSLDYLLKYRLLTCLLFAYIQVTSMYNQLSVTRKADIDEYAQVS